MTNRTNGQFTDLLERIASGDDEAKRALVKVAYDELHRLATTLMHNERSGRTLQPTALVHEAVLKLFDRHALDNIPNRAYFFWVASRGMRQVLVDHARRRDRVRRDCEANQKRC